ncbi:MAG: phosphoglycerate kinase [Parcubacteria group bacterium]
MKTLKEFNFQRKKVLVRCDFNIPQDNEGNILDDYKIKQTLPTINYLLNQGAGLVLISHLGRPDGKVIESLKLKPVAERLSQLLGRRVEISNKNIKPGEMILLENIQFNPGEKNNDPAFAKTLSDLGDIFVMEAFGQAHRAFASISGINNFLPSAAGFLMEKEIQVLKCLLENPIKPLVAVIGGKKVEDKSRVIDKISVLADFVLISGLIKKEINEKKILLKYPQKLISPSENLGAPDIDEKTINAFKEIIKGAKTVFWSGPFGKIEEKEFQKGTEEIIKAIIKSRAFSVAGGGETVEFINKLGLIDKFNHVSTGGGAMLAFLAGEKLPGIEALK